MYIVYVGIGTGIGISIVIGIGISIGISISIGIGIGVFVLESVVVWPAINQAGAGDAWGWVADGGGDVLRTFLPTAMCFSSPPT